MSERKAAIGFRRIVKMQRAEALDAVADELEGWVAELRSSDGFGTVMVAGRVEGISDVQSMIRAKAWGLRREARELGR